MTIEYSYIISMDVIPSVVVSNCSPHKKIMRKQIIDSIVELTDGR